MTVTRRNHPAATGSAPPAASPRSAAVKAQDDRHDDDAEVLYGHGLVWNRALPGVAGALKLAFKLRVNLKTGTGFGTAHDPLCPDWNVHFAIESAERTRLRTGESQYMVTGVVTQANGAFSAGLTVRILVQTRGDATAIAIAIADLTFAGAVFVVHAPITTLIGAFLRWTGSHPRQRKETRDERQIESCAM